MRIPERHRDTVRRHCLLAAAAGVPGSIIPADWLALAKIWTDLTRKLAAEVGYDLSQSGAREIVRFALGKGVIGYAAGTGTLWGSSKIFQSRLLKYLTKHGLVRITMAGTAVASGPVYLGTLAIYYSGTAAANSMLNALYTHRFAAAICEVLERGSVEAVDVLELATDLIPLINLDRLGLDKEAFASEVLAGIKKLPRPTELFDLMRSLFDS